jgi:hypothetical protein
MVAPVTENQVKLGMAVLLSLVLVAAALYILIGDNASGGLEKAATGWIGIIIGYWIK